jgi:phosphonate transport system permease protein
MALSTTSPPAARSPEPVYLRPSAGAFALVLLGVAAALAAARAAEVDPGLLLEPRSLQNVRDFLAGLLPPAHSAAFLRVLLPAVAQTVAIAAMGMAVALVIGFPLALLGTRHLADSRVARVRYGAVRALLGALRAVPELVWALLVIRMGAGLGPFAGVVAIGIVYGGMLGKVFSELLEAVPEGPVEALKATGASRAAVAVYVLVPLAFPGLVSYALYRFECAIRAAAVLGLVGAGGLGMQLELSMKMFAYDEVGTTLAATVLLVVAVDRLSAVVRRQLEAARLGGTGLLGPRAAAALAVAAVGVVAAALATGFRPWTLLRPDALAGAAAFVGAMLPPDLSGAYLVTVGRAALQTLAVSLVSILLAVALGVVLGVGAVDPALHQGLLAFGRPGGLLAALRRLAYLGCRAALAVTRSIPEMFWALLFVLAIGLGPFAGVLALGLHTGGVLGKLYAEVAETVDDRPLEALRSTGASRLATLLYGALPQMLPTGLSYTLYRWEISIREATVLGFVGAGGLGYELYVRLNLFHYRQLATLLLAIFGLVVLVDGLSAWLRRRVT